MPRAFRISSGIVTLPPDTTFLLIDFDSPLNPTTYAGAYIYICTNPL